MPGAGRVEWFLDLRTASRNLKSELCNKLEGTVTHIPQATSSRSCANCSHLRCSLLARCHGGAILFYLNMGRGWTWSVRRLGNVPNDTTWFECECTLTNLPNCQPSKTLHTTFNSPELYSSQDLKGTLRVTASFPCASPSPHHGVFCSVSFVDL